MERNDVGTHPEDIMKQWLDNLPKEAQKNLQVLKENSPKFETFDLLSNISYYNHLHNLEQYTDFRGDKNFVASEVVALVCLQQPAKELGVSFMASKFKDELDFKLKGYCRYKMEQTNINTWIGIGDTCPDADRYKIELAFLLTNE